MCHADLKPSLVIIGREAEPSKRAPYVRFLPASPNLRQRVVSSILGNGSQDKTSINGQDQTQLSKTAHEFGIDAMITSEAHSVRTRARLHAQEADIFVVAGFHQLLSDEVLGLAKYDGINVHPGKLPQQRGPAPYFGL